MAYPSTEKKRIQEPIFGSSAKVLKKEKEKEIRKSERRGGSLTAKKKR